MKTNKTKTISKLLVSGFTILFTTQTYAFCDGTQSISDRACKNLTETWNEGNDSVYLPFYAYHLRSAYSKEKIDSFREDTYGIGYGRTRYDEKNNSDELYGMVFLDSHSKPEYIAGFAHQWIAGTLKDVHAAIGYTAFLTARSDIMDYTPIPGILPIASVGYKKININTTFIPGTKGNGNVFFFWSKIEL